MSRWFRLYDEMLDDPKVQRLHPALFKVLVNLWCVASRHDGLLPTAADMSFSLRMTEDETFRAVSKLADAGFIDTDTATGEQRPHGWDKRQFRSDVSTDRVRSHRKRQKTEDKPNPPGNGNGEMRNGDETFHVTPPETEQIQNRTDSSVAIATGTVVPHPASDFCKAVFDSGIALLRREDPEMTERNARSIVGRWRKTAKDPELMTLLMEAETKSYGLEWVVAAVETRNGKRTGSEKPEPALELLRQAEAAGASADWEVDSRTWPSLPSYGNDRS